MDEIQEILTYVDQYVQTSYPKKKKPDLINKPKQNRKKKERKSSSFQLLANALLCFACQFLHVSTVLLGVLLQLSSI